jgi:hypothetical protein
MSRVSAKGEAAYAVAADSIGTRRQVPESALRAVRIGAVVS